MAKVTPGPLISAIAGSVGSATFRNSRSGLILSNRPLTTDRASPAQLEHRRLICAAAAAWSLLDADIVTAWNTLARQEPIPSFFSRGRKWTGRQLFTCFFLQAEKQLTPLPARWLPTPPLFFLSIHFTVAVFLPCYHEPNPDNHPDWPEGWYSDTYAFLGRPKSLVPGPPPIYSTDFPTTLYIAFAPVNSPAIPKRWTSFLPLTPPYQPEPAPPPSIAGAFGCYDSSFAIPNLIAPPSGFFPGMSAPVARNFATWIDFRGLSDERIYYTGAVRVPGTHSLNGTFADEPTAIMNTFSSYFQAHTLNASSNYPKTEV